jgi:hypothetical protein
MIWKHPAVEEDYDKLKSISVKYRIKDHLGWRLVYYSEKTINYLDELNIQHRRHSSVRSDMEEYFYLLISDSDMIFLERKVITNIRKKKLENLDL